MKIRPEAQWLIALFATAAAALASQASGQTPTTAIPAASEILARAASALDPLGTLSNHSSTHSAATVEVARHGDSRKRRELCRAAEPPVHEALVGCRRDRVGSRRNDRLGDQLLDRTSADGQRAVGARFDR